MTDTPDISALEIRREKYRDLFLKTKLGREILIDMCDAAAVFQPMPDEGMIGENAHAFRAGQQQFVKQIFMRAGITADDIFNPNLSK